MKALITGIGGFVGPYLAKHLLENGIEVFGTYLEEPCDAEAEQFQLDITDKNAVSEIILKIRPDLVFHLAGFSSVGASWKNPELCSKVNIGGTKNLLDALSAMDKEVKVLLVSSAQVYGKPDKLPIKEDAELKPESPYARSRLGMEKLAKEYAQLKIIISRSFNHIGPGQQLGFVASDFANQIAEIENTGQKPVLSVGNLDAKRDFTDVKDMVKAYLLALQKGKPGEIYNICSGESWSMQHILDTLLELSKTKIMIEHDPERMRPSDIPELRGNNSKFIKQTGWKPAIPLESTLREILEYWRRNV